MGNNDNNDNKDDHDNKTRIVTLMMVIFAQTPIKKKNKKTNSNNTNSAITNGLIRTSLIQERESHRQTELQNSMHEPHVYTKMIIDFD